jgi:hypothetical protein
MLLALKLSQSNKSVLVVEKDSSVGGAWSTAVINPKLGIEIETACHLIENYAGIYKKISTISGVDFQSSSPPPTRISRKGRRKKYFARTSPLVELSEVIAVIVAFFVIRALNLVLPKKIEKTQQLTLSGLIERLNFTVSYRIPEVFSSRGVMEPVDGFASFMQTLVQKVQKSDISFIKSKLLDVDQVDGRPLSISLGLGQVLAWKVYLPESTDISLDSNIAKTLNLVNEPKKKSFWHLLVEVEILVDFGIPSYIHVSEDEIVHRLTSDVRVRASTSKRIFLVQALIEPNPKNLDSILLRLVEVFSKCNINVKSSQIEVKSVFEDSFYSSREDSIFYGSTRHEDIVVFPSIGDLSRNIAINPLFR